MDLYIGKYSITELIPTGEENAKSKRELSLKTGLSSREIIRCIFTARKEGLPICSTNNGYYIPQSIEEAMSYHKRQSSRIYSGRIALKPITEFIKREGTAQQWAELERIEKELADGQRETEV